MNIAVSIPVTINEGTEMLKTIKSSDMHYFDINVKV